MLGPMVSEPWRLVTKRYIWICSGIDDYRDGVGAFFLTYRFPGFLPSIDFYKSPKLLILRNYGLSGSYPDHTPRLELLD
jgi:hypothetical protein